MPSAKDMPGKWSENYVRFKGEKPNINIQLGNKDGPGIHIFNKNIEGYRVLRK
jgi:hypothetical protein